MNLQVSSITVGKRNWQLLLRLAMVFLWCAFSISGAHGETGYQVTTIAGSPGISGSANGPGDVARFSAPGAVAVDKNGNIIVEDNNAIRKITTDGVVSTSAGTPGISGTADGQGSAALFKNPIGIAVDALGNTFVADRDNHTIRKITPGGVVSTLAGRPGTSGTANGVGSDARFAYPCGLALDKDGNLYVADSSNHAIRKITAEGVVTTLAGKPGLYANLPVDGPVDTARFGSPFGIAVDASDNIYVSDNDTIRKITAGGIVSTLAGTSTRGSADGTGSAAQFRQPSGLAVDKNGAVFVADALNNSIRKITPEGVVTTIAGGRYGSADGDASVAQFNFPYGVAVDEVGNIYVADAWNKTIRKITRFPVVKLQGSNPLTLYPNTTYTDPGATATDADGIALTPAITVNTVVSDQLGSYRVQWSATDSMGLSGSAVRTINVIAAPPNPIVTTGTASAIGLKSATLNGTVDPVGLTTTVQFEYGPTTAYGITSTITIPPGFDTTAQNVTVNISGLQPEMIYHYRVFATNSKGVGAGSDATFTTAAPVVVSTLAGSPGKIGSSDGTGSAAWFYWPNSLAVAENGDVYVADRINATIRKITAAGAVTTFAGSPGVRVSADGNGSNGHFFTPNGIAVAGDGTVYVADDCDQTIRKITPAQDVTTFAGSSTVSGTDDGPSNNARFSNPENVAVDAAGNVYVVEFNHTLRMITPAGIVTTIAGAPGVSGTADGVGSAARFNSPSGVAVDVDGNVLISDTLNHTIRKATLSGISWIVTTVAGSPGLTGSSDGQGSAARFNNPYGIAVDKNKNVYVADSKNHIIRKITPEGMATTLAGNPGTTGSANGYGASARFNTPCGIAVDSNGCVYVADTNNNTIRKIALADQVLPTITLTGLSPLNFEAASAYNDPGATGSDIYEGNLVPTLVSNNVVPNQPGSYLVKWMATNSLGFAATATRTVNVVDTTPPIIRVPANITVNALSATGAIVSFPTSAWDIVSGDIAPTNSPASGTVFPIGTTTVTTTASDAAGNATSRTFSVTVAVPPMSEHERIAPQMNLSHDSATLTVKSTVPGRTYVLQFSNDLSSGSWQDVGTVQVGNGNDLHISAPRDAAATRGFYRLKLN